MNGRHVAVSAGRSMVAARACEAAASLHLLTAEETCRYQDGEDALSNALEAQMSRVRAVVALLTWGLT